jgi:hypothetical protein
MVYVLAAASFAFAHHGTAEFDNSKPARLKGTVTEFVWSNPHGSIDLDVHDGKGNVEKWHGFLTSPNWLVRVGWSKDTLKPGDEIGLTGSLSKHRMHLLKVSKVQLASGQELAVGGIEN